MKILFLDQSGKLGGAELSLMDIATFHRDRCLVGLFADGAFYQALKQRQVPAKILTQQALNVRKESSFWQSLGSLGQLLPLVANVVQLSREYDIIYANTQKALVVGAIASLFSRRPFIYHLRDILSEEHFSRNNVRLAVTLANWCATKVITNSKATQAAFVAAGGDAERTSVVYNGFQPEHYQSSKDEIAKLRQELNLEGCYAVGHFSRLSPWKGQHILLEALLACPREVVAVFVGDALFGETQYIETLQRKVQDLGLTDRVRFLGFRSDIPQLMGACDLIAHTSTAAEPFGRVIVEAMFSDRPIVAAEAGGAVELIQHGVTGWLTPPGDVSKLADIINHCREAPEQTATISQQAKLQAMQRFHVDTLNQRIENLLVEVVHKAQPDLAMAQLNQP
ncbi:MAG: glycosyltransferase [Leptolyngbyaceae cyanobacterium bins.302]|nr:glycosyltransferase [Leptolyngbyaceae cyanobacterium bins.302]